jgi:hypothetical protein
MKAVAAISASEVISGALPDLRIDGDALDGGE